MTAQGNAVYNRELEAAVSVRAISLQAKSMLPQIVHGTDDRTVMSNTIYPHRTQIVFDNTGSTSTINGAEGSTGYVRGYPGLGTCGNPGVSCNIRVWGDTSSPSENNATSSTIEHQADTSGGQSGSGFYHYADPSCSGCGYGPYLVGMHRAGSSSYNLARRFTSTVYSFLLAYSSDY